MAHPTGESKDGALKLDFDRRLMVQFRGCVVTSDAGLLAYRELDDALGLSAVAGETLADARTGKNGHHALVGLLRQSVFGRLAGYEDVNDAERLRHDPAMRWIVGGQAAQGRAASPSQMVRFETQWLAAPAKLSALSDLSGQWIDIVHGRRPPKGIVLDMDSSPSAPAKTVPEFVAYAKVNPGKINMASGGNGTVLHVAGEVFKMVAGIHMQHVPYRGDAPAWTDLIGGQVQVMFAGLPSSIAHIRAGKLRPLAVASAT